MLRLVREQSVETSLEEVLRREDWHVIAFQDEDCDIYCLVGLVIDNLTYWAFHPLWCDGSTLYQATNVETTLKQAMLNHQVYVFTCQDEFGEWIIDG